MEIFTSNLKFVLKYKTFAAIKKTGRYIIETKQRLKENVFYFLKSYHCKIFERSFFFLKEQKTIDIFKSHIQLMNCQCMVYDTNIIQVHKEIINYSKDFLLFKMFLKHDG